MSSIAEEFEKAMYEVYERAKRDYHYKATLFLAMLQRDGGLATAQKLLAKDAPQYGLLRLSELGALKNSMENTVLNPRFAELFLTRERETARQRLLDFGFTPGGWEE